MELMDKTGGNLGTLGDAFGSMGEGYVQLALVLPEKIREMIEVIDQSGILKRVISKEPAREQTLYLPRTGFF